MIEILIYAVVALITITIPGWYVFRHRKTSGHARETLRRAQERGMDEPVSLHPLIDPNKCIGSGACVKACPEKDVLGLIDNRVALISPSRCIGHGLCQAACPVDAITLVFGTEKRGIDIPDVSGTFESNVKGIFIAGELGGMGLIRNAVTQGTEAADYIASGLEQDGGSDLLDLIIVGAGPAGIGASLQAKRHKLRFITVDQEDLGGTILTYPRKKLVMTRPMELPLYGKLSFKQIEKEELLEIFTDVFNKTGLSVRSGEKVVSITNHDNYFTVVTTKQEYDGRRVLLAIGRRGSPRKLGVPGERSPKVTYRLIDPEHYQRTNALVVGGGDSALEAACALAEQPDTTVHLSYRREAIFRVKDENRVRLENAVETGNLIPIFRSTVVRIEPGSVVLSRDDDEITLENDQVFIFAGGELPSAFLQKIGIAITRKFGEA